MRKKEVKSTFLVIVCIIALFIPTYIAIAAYIAGGSASLDSSSVSKIELSDLDNKSYTFNGNKDETVKLFTQMTANATALSAQPEQLYGRDYYKVTCTVGSKDRVYQYYFDTAGGSSYFVDDNGITYRVAKDDSDKFINTAYASSLYKSSGAPLLTTSASDESVLPTAINWQYKSANGQYVAAAPAIAGNASATYSMDDSMKLNFNIAPDTFNVKIYENGKLIFDKAYSELEKLDTTANTALVIVAEAEWFKDSTRDFYGTAKYEFTARIMAPAAFYLGRLSIEPGEFTVVTAYNIEDVSKVTFKSEPALTYNGEIITPVFYKDGDCARAFIPVSCTAESGSYVLTFGYGAKEQTTNLTIKAKTFAASAKTVTPTVANATYNDKTLADFKSVFDTITASSESNRLWSEGHFETGVSESTYSVKIGFGRMVTISANNKTYRNDGVEFSLAADKNVIAVSSGKVCYVGVTDYSGRMVVIDHGMGLKSWYMHLSESSVAVGDNVARGDTIGKSGSTGFTEGGTLFVLHTINKVPVCPYSMWQDADADLRGIVMFEK